MSAAWNWLTRHRRAALVVAGLGGLVVPTWFSMPLRGAAAAWVDASRGHYEVKVYGLPNPWDWRAAALARERHGVEVNAVAGCVVTESLVSYVDAYNSVSVPRIRARFGRDVVAECETEARADWVRDHPRE